MATAAEVEDKPGLDKLVDAENFSKLCRLVRVTAWVKRFVHNLKTVINKERGKQTARYLQVSELNTAEREWVKVAQDSLKLRNNFSQLTQELRLVEDKETGLLKCKGRLANAHLESDAK